MMKKRLGAESVTNDRKGHIVDPEEVPVRPVMSSDEIV
jgi:hypothetical protein